MPGGGWKGGGEAEGGNDGEGFVGGAVGAAYPSAALVVSNRAGVSGLVPAFGPALSRAGLGRADRRGGEGVFDWIGGGSERVGCHAECGVQRVALFVSGGV